MIVASTTSNKVSWNEPSNLWDSFTVWWLGSFLGHRHMSSYAVDADANNDGKVSAAEAFNFAYPRSSPPNVATYEDNGACPGWRHQMPYGGDGALGLATYL